MHAYGRPCLSYGRSFAGARIETHAVVMSDDELASLLRGSADRNGRVLLDELREVVAPSRERGSKREAMCVERHHARRRSFAGARIETAR